MALTTPLALLTLIVISAGFTSAKHLPAKVLRSSGHVCPREIKISANRRGVGFRKPIYNIGRRQAALKALAGEEPRVEEEENPYSILQKEAEKKRQFDSDYIKEQDMNFEIIKFGSLKESIDSFLIADFFFVLASLAWLALGLGWKLALKSEAIYTAWYALWTPVFQPALGLLMAGTIISGLNSYFNDNQDETS
ncbi:hypothetical protein AAMO2058_001084700 [Amorphochlora amoebiformis]